MDKIDDLSIGDRCVVSKYIDNPLVISNQKFDFRIYVLITGCSPLRLFIYEEGLTRFCTKRYEKPSDSNIANRFIHLTNYSINKTNPNFEFNQDSECDDVGHKRSLTSIFSILEEQGADIDTIWSEICEIVIKTVVMAQPYLKANYTRHQNGDLFNGM